MQGAWAGEPLHARTRSCGYLHVIRPARIPAWTGDWLLRPRPLAAEILANGACWGSVTLLGTWDCWEVTQVSKWSHSSVHMNNTMGFSKIFLKRRRRHKAVRDPCWGPSRRQSKVVRDEYKSKYKHTHTCTYIHILYNAFWFLYYLIHHIKYNVVFSLKMSYLLCT